MKIKHNESGKILDVMDGTLYPISAYTLVDEEADKKAAAEAKAAAKAQKEADKKVVAEAKADKK